MISYIVDSIKKKCSAQDLRWMSKRIKWGTIIGVLGTIDALGVEVVVAFRKNVAVDDVCRAVGFEWL